MGGVTPAIQALVAKFRAKSAGSLASRSRALRECADALEAALSAQPPPASAPVGVDAEIECRCGLRGEVGRLQTKAMNAVDAARTAQSLQWKAEALTQQPSPTAPVVVDGLARSMFEAQADPHAASWDRQWEPTRVHWREQARIALAQQQPVAAEKALSVALAYVGQRTDGDLPTLAERCALWMRESKSLIDYPTPPRAQQPAAVDEASDLFYIQDSRDYVGNCPLWWCPEGRGYTTRLDEAGKYTRDDAMRQHRSRETDVPWPCEQIDAISRPTVDMQDMRALAQLQGAG